MLTDSDTREAAATLERATAAAQPVPPLTERWADMDVGDAYAIQEIVIGNRLAAGARRVGWKVGLTSEAMQNQLGVDQPDFGPLLDDMEVADGGVCPLADLIAPRVEGEIAFRLSRDLEGDGLGDDEVLAACESAVPALEIIDSRIVDWRIALADTIADHASAARYVVGSGGCAADELDLAAAAMRMLEDGAEVERGRGAAVLGHPVRAVAWLAATLGTFGERLRAGDVILAGALAAAIPARPGAIVEADFGAPLGSVRVEFGTAVAA
jgi:2-keto-4-pentenoate hydratase